MALRVGLEPTTYRLTAGCSAIELPKKTLYWRLPTLPGRYHPSTIGVKRLNFCVRYGYRCLPLAIVTRLKTTLELLVYFKHELLWVATLAKSKIWIARHLTYDGIVDSC